MRHAVLTSTFTDGFDKHVNLSIAERIKRSPRARQGIARGVLLGFGAALCFLPNAGSSETNATKQYIDYKTYSLYLLDFNYKQYDCLDELYTHESNWNPSAVNGSHHGIPQGKSDYLASLNGYDQVVWGLAYIGNRYGEPCVALNHWKVYGWH